MRNSFCTRLAWSAFKEGAEWASTSRQELTPEGALSLYCGVQTGCSNIVRAGLCHALPPDAVRLSRLRFRVRTADFSASTAFMLVCAEGVDGAADGAGVVSWFQQRCNAGQTEYCL